MNLIGALIYSQCDKADAEFAGVFALLEVRWTGGLGDEKFQTVGRGGKGEVQAMGFRRSGQRQGLFAGAGLDLDRRANVGTEGVRGEDEGEVGGQRLRKLERHGPAVAPAAPGFMAGQSVDCGEEGGIARFAEINAFGQRSRVAVRGRRDRGNGDCRNFGRFLRAFAAGGQRQGGGER